MDTTYGTANFTNHQLVVFRTVANCLSYTKAAEALYLSQPAVSQQIKTLEQTLGLQLFARRGRGIDLTPAGKEFLQHTERLLGLLAETATVVQEIHALARGSVLLGASTSAATYVVLPLLNAFHALYPRIHVTLTVADHHFIEERLLTRQVDLAVMSLIEQPERFVIESLMPHDLAVVAPPAHALVQRSALATLTIHDLIQETFLLREQGSGTRLDTEQYFAHAGIPLQESLELGSIEAIKEGVVAGLGIAVIPREAVELEIANGDLVMLNVEGFPLQRQWYMVHLQGRRLARAAAVLRKIFLQSRRNIDTNT
jgi:LysR family transcriptional regulator, low CO2-responsive transcriptional regulator